MYHFTSLDQFVADFRVANDDERYEMLAEWYDAWEDHMHSGQHTDWPPSPEITPVNVGESQPRYQLCLYSGNRASDEERWFRNFPDDGWHRGGIHSIGNRIPQWRRRLHPGATLSVMCNMIIQQYELLNEMAS